MIRLVIVDDHDIVRQGLRFVLSQQPGIDVVAECADGQSAIEAVRALLPSVVLLDLVMPGVGGIAALQQIRQHSPTTHVVVLTSHLGEDHVIEAVKAGATSYVLKTAPVPDIVEAVRGADRGDSHVDATVAGRVLQELRDPPKMSKSRLTSREVEVLTLIARGRSNRDIAERLVIGEQTVKTHVSNILAKLHLQDRTQAAIYALREGLVPPNR